MTDNEIGIQYSKQTKALAALTLTENTEVTSRVA